MESSYIRLSSLLPSMRLAINVLPKRAGRKHKQPISHRRRNASACGNSAVSKPPRSPLDLLLKTRGFPSPTYAGFGFHKSFFHTIRYTPFCALSVRFVTQRCDPLNATELSFKRVSQRVSYSFGGRAIRE